MLPSDERNLLRDATRELLITNCAQDCPMPSLFDVKPSNINNVVEKVIDDVEYITCESDLLGFYGILDAAYTCYTRHLWSTYFNLIPRTWLEIVNHSRIDFLERKYHPVNFKCMVSRVSLCFVENCFLLETLKVMQILLHLEATSTT